MSPLRPRIGIEQIDAQKRARRQPIDQCASVAEMQPDVRKLMQIDLGQRLRNAIDKGVAANVADGRMRTRLRNQMFGASESYFEMYILGVCKKGTQVSR